MKILHMFDLIFMPSLPINDTTSYLFHDWIFRDNLHVVTRSTMGKYCKDIDIWHNGKNSNSIHREIIIMEPQVIKNSHPTHNGSHPWLLNHNYIEYLKEPKIDEHI